MKSCQLASILVFAALLCLIAPARADDVESGPAVGKKVPALKVHSVVGPNEGKEADAAKVRAKLPTIYVFIKSDRWGRPTARFLKDLDTAVTEIAKDSKIVAVWLSDDIDKSKDYLPRAQQSIKLESTWLAVYAGEARGPDAWNLADKADVTAVVANNAKVTARFGITSPNDTSVRPVAAALKAALAPATPVGLWKWSVDADNDALTLLLKLKLTNDKLTGTAQWNDKDPVEIANATFKDGQLTFNFDRIRSNGDKVTHKFTGKLEGDTITATVAGNFGGEDQELSVEFTRQKE